MRQPLTIWLGAIYFVLVAVCAGCNRGPIVVTGTVTYQGKPLPKGAITFTPMDGTVAPTTMTAIIDGKYNIEPARALPTGTYRVSITAIREGSGRVVRPAMGDDRAPPPDPATEQQYIPTKYNVQTQLKMTLEPSRSAVTRDFALTD